MARRFDGTVPMVTGAGAGAGAETGIGAAIARGLGADRASLGSTDAGR